MKKKFNVIASCVIATIILFTTNNASAVSHRQYDDESNPDINKLLNIPIDKIYLANSNQACTSTCEQGTQATKSLDFEQLGDYSDVGSNYSNLGLEFEGAVVLGQGGSLNFLEFPPHSGVNVIYDYMNHTEPGKISIFLNPSITGNVFNVGGYVTGNRNVTMTAYNFDGVPVGNVETGGANNSSVGTPNMLLEITTLEPISKVIFFNGGERGNTYTVDDFFYSSEQSCQIPNVPIYKQSNPNWGNDYYGGSESKPWYDPDRGGIALLKNWGCALTSAAMVVSYHGSQQNGFTTTPKLLNEWLRKDENKGYSGGSILWDRVAAYARANGVNLYYYPGTVRNEGVVNTLLCNNSPVILNTTTSPYAGHWLVAYGQSTTDSWAVNDPGGHNLTTLNYNAYARHAKYGETRTEPTSLVIVAHSPLQFLITDPAGRRTGYDPSTGSYVYEILDSEYYIDRLDGEDGAFTESLVLTAALPFRANIKWKYLVRVLGRSK